MFKKFNFMKLSQARVKQRQMKKSFGYKPTIFMVKNPRTNKSRYVVVKPHGLKRIN